MVLALLPVSTQCEVSEMGSTGACGAGHTGSPCVTLDEEGWALQTPSGGIVLGSPWSCTHWGTALLLPSTCDGKLAAGYSRPSFMPSFLPPAGPKLLLFLSLRHSQLYGWGN